VVRSVIEADEGLVVLDGTGGNLIPAPWYGGVLRH